MVATALTRAAAFRGSSAAADMPTGKPSAEPRPQSTTPTAASQTTGARIDRQQADDGERGRHPQHRHPAEAVEQPDAADPARPSWR